MKYSRHVVADGAGTGPSIALPDTVVAGDWRQKLYKTEAGYRTMMAWYASVKAEISVPVRSMYVETRFGRTHMLVAGGEQAPPLFLIPGIAGCAPLWRRQIPAFAEKFRVYALDIPGQPGHSDPNPPSLLNRDYVDWLTDVLDELGIAKASFAGVSVGGWIAMQMGIEAPERVDRVVMLGPTGLARARLPVRIWLTRVLARRKNADVLEDELTARSVTTPSPGASFGTFDRQLARAMALATRHYRVDRSVGVYNEATGRISWRKGLGVLRKFFLAEPRSRLRQFKVPGLLIFGQHELFFDPVKVGNRARGLMTGLTVAVVKDAGHAAIYDKPDEVNTMIVDYLLGQSTAR